MVKELRLFFLDVGVSNAKDGGGGPQGRILSCRPDGSDLETVLEGIGSIPDGLAIDPHRRQIYYTNMGECVWTFLFFIFSPSLVPVFFFFFPGARTRFWEPWSQLLLT